MNAENENGFDELSQRLQAERPVPRAAFRAELRRLLLGEATTTVTRARIRGLVVAYAGSGLALLAVVAIGIAGSGPFAA